MGLLYASGFQVNTALNMTCTVDALPATITSGYYMPGDYATADVWPTPVAASWTGTAYTSFATEVAAALTAAAGTYTCTYSTVTGKYTVASAGTFTLDFATAADLRLRAALGFTGNKSGAASYTSDVAPAYSMVSTIEGRTNVLGPYEPDDIAEESVSDGGVDHVITRKTGERLMSWVQQMEPRTAVDPWALDPAGTGGVGWTWKEWFAHTRGTHPFVCNEPLLGESGGAFYRLSAKGASFKPQRYTADFDDYWTVPFATRHLGAYKP